MTHPLEEIRRQVREAQENFATDVDAILDEMKACAAALSPAIGEISPGEALAEVRKVTVAAIDRRLLRRAG